MPADAQLYVDGQRTNLTSTTRTFTTPQLQLGRDYYYTVMAEAVRDGRTATESKRVVVRAGYQSRVTFADLTAPAVQAKETSAPARITVRLPADARLFVNGEACTLTSTTRSFETPRLEAGKDYAYTFKAEVVRDGRTRSEDRRVVFQAGKQVTVDFGNLAPASVASR